MADKGLRYHFCGIRCEEECVGRWFEGRMMFRSVMRLGQEVKKRWFAERREIPGPECLRFRVVSAELVHHVSLEAPCPPHSRCKHSLVL